MEKIETLYLDNPEKYLVECGLKLESASSISNKKSSECPICLEVNLNNENLMAPLECKHTLCRNCWKDYIDFLVFKFPLNEFFLFPFLDFRLCNFSILEMSL